MDVDPEAGEVNKGDLGKRRIKSVEQWNLVRKLIYDISGNAVPRRTSRPCRRVTSGYETGCRRDSSDELMKKVADIDASRKRFDRHQGEKTGPEVRQSDFGIRRRSREATDGKKRRRSIDVPDRRGTRRRSTLSM